MRGTIAALGLVALAPGCFESRTPDGGPDPGCTTSAMCAPGSICIDGVCAPDVDARTGCRSSSDCPSGHRCIDTRCVPAAAAETRQYVISTLAIPEPTFRTGSRAGIAAGFDLDGLATVGDPAALDCVTIADDYVSLETGEAGVDNAFAGLVPSLGPLFAGDCPPGAAGSECVAAIFAQQIASGRTLIAIEVGDVESFDADADGVTIDVYAARRPSCFAGCRWDGARCAADPWTGSLASSPVACGALATRAACTAAPMDVASCAPALAGGLLAPGQTFERGPVLSSGTATLSGGRIAGEAMTLPLELRLTDWTLPLDLVVVEIGAAISRDALRSAAIGGRLSVDAFVTSIDEFMPGIGPTARSLLEGIADLSPSRDPMICRELSAGIDFTAVSATLAP
jgi:hypothetical protein